MGYACPVCATPQRDADHLANHLAFTAMLHGDAHETWLDEHAPGWGEAGVAELAPVVVEYAEGTDYDEVFEERVPEGGGDPGHDHDHQRLPAGTPLDAGDADGDAQRILAEAREMTRAMLEGTDDGDDDSDDDNKA
jgi:hypothetical protein